MSALITIQWSVPVGYDAGDYAMLCGNNGEGDIDWDNPLTNQRFELFPAGAGIYGWGHAPWGHHRWGHPHSMRTAGWGHLSWGHFPWGLGTAIITANHTVTACGDYKFGFACYDKLGNPHEGEPEEASLEIHIAPPAPTGLTKNSYDKDTDILILNAA